MAAIGKIRSWGTVLVIILGVVLLFFIAEPFGDFIRSRSAASGRVVGKVLGDKLDIQEYQTLVDEYQELLKLQGRDDLDENDLNNLRDYIWQTYVQGKLVENETSKLGLTVTDQEMATILQDGTHPMLAQAPLIGLFINQSTGKFDLNQVTAYREAMKTQAASNPAAAEQAAIFERCWQYAERSLRQQLLTNKYQALLAGCMMTNPISARATFDGQNTESQILLATLPYSSINDNDVEVSDADLKAKYNELKGSLKTYNETRAIKYVAYQVVASDKDRAELMAQMKDAQAKLQGDSAQVSDIIRASQSLEPYFGLPVTSSALPDGVAARLDSMSVGQVSEPFETRRDNTLNVVKLINRVQQPDSVEFRMISLVGRKLDAAEKSADSIMNALQAGAPFDSIAKNYGQAGAKIWLTSLNIQNVQNMDADNKTYFKTILSMASGERKNLKLSQGNVVIQVTDRRHNVEKYDVAIVKRAINFSNETYSEAFNKFSQYVSENQTIQGLEEHAAEYGFNVLDRTITNDVHTIANIHGTHDALKWVFDEAKPGNVSQVFDRCGDNDYLVVVALDKINPKGYQDPKDVEVMLKQEVIRDKKFAQLSQKFAGVTSIAAARQAGAKIDTVKFITFNSPVYVPSVGQAESSLSGAVAGVEKGQFSKHVVKGNAGAYLFQVLDRKQRDGVTYDEVKQKRSMQQSALSQTLGMAFQVLQNKADVEDKRYMFF